MCLALGRVWDAWHLSGGQGLSLRQLRATAPSALVEFGWYLFLPKKSHHFDGPWSSRNKTIVNFRIFSRKWLLMYFIQENQPLWILIFKVRIPAYLPYEDKLQSQRCHSCCSPVCLFQLPAYLAIGALPWKVPARSLRLCGIGMLWQLCLSKHKFPGALWGGGENGHVSLNRALNIRNLPTKGVLDSIAISPRRFLCTRAYFGT